MAKGLVAGLGCLLWLRLAGETAEVQLVGLAFPGENMVDITVLIHNRNPLSAKA